MAQSKEYKECVRVYNRVNNISISPDMSIYDSCYYHQRASEETMNEAWYYEMEKEGDNTQDVLDCIDTMKGLLAYLKSAEKLETLTQKTNELAIV